MTDLDARIARLRRKLEAADDSEDRADLEAAIAALERERASMASVEAHSHTQHIGGYATIAAAIAGDVHGDLYVVGERAQSTRQLLAGYLRWLASQCGQLPLRGVREQKTATDVLEIGLDQVYMQLATTALVERVNHICSVLDRSGITALYQEYVYSPGAVAHLLWGEQESNRESVRCEKCGYVLPQEVASLTRSRHLLRKIVCPVCEAILIKQVALFVTPVDQFAELVNQANTIKLGTYQLVTEAITANSRLVLLGEPGSGKSTGLRYLALTLARAGLDDTFDVGGRLEGWPALGASGKLIPLFMPLLPLARRLVSQPGRNGTAADLWSAIDAHLMGHGATGDVVTAMRAELAQGHVLLLLDGLDEVAGGASRRQVVEAVRAFAVEHPQCRIVVACRVRAYEGDQNASWQLPGWPTATLADWTPGQVRAFVAAWYAAAATASRMPDSKRDERVAVLQRAISERDDLRRLSIRPLLLTIMALVHLNDGKLPEDRVTLYSRCLDILLGQWEIAGKDETIYGTLMQYIGLPDADVKTLRPLLARVAYAAHTAAAEGEVGRLRRADLRELVADALEQLKHPNPHEGAKRFLEYTDVRAGLLQATEAGDAYAFPHQTFQEYLAGLELISGVGFVDRIMQRRDEDRWRVPIFLGVGHTVSEGVLSAPYQLLSRLLHARGRDQARRQRDLMFAAELAEDVGWDRLERGGEEFGALRHDLAEALAVVVEGTALPAAERVQAALYLGQLGDPREGVCGLPPQMVPIADASFVIGMTADELGRLSKDEQSYFSDTRNSHSAIIKDFAIARYPVTNAQYALFIADDGYKASAPWWSEIPGSIAWLKRERRRAPDYWGHERFGIARPNHPVVTVTWYEAMAFCRWLTRHEVYNPEGYTYTLPSEAEWEYAARGAECRPYPWGAEVPDGERANFNEMYLGTTAVGCFSGGATPEGVQDLAGNLWEWTRSEYRDYPYDPNDGREDIAEPTKKRFTLRGGGWDNVSIYLRASGRYYLTPGSHDNDVGFRLARLSPVSSVS